MSPAGWYPDPADPSLLRYWDGEAWSPHVAPAFSESATSTHHVVLTAVPVVEPDLATERVERLSGIVASKLAAFAPATVEPAWCEDPVNRLQARAWDGAAWTGRVATRPLATVPTEPAQPIAPGDLGREGVHWPSARESRYLNRCVPTLPGWYADPLAPALRGRRWGGTWSEQVRPRRDVAIGSVPDDGVTSVAAPEYGDPEDIARTGRSLVAWAVIGVLSIALGVASVFDPRHPGGSLLPVWLGIAALVRAYMAHAKLRSLGQR